MKTLLVLASWFTLFLASSTLEAMPFDTKHIQWSQPNGVTFTARLWGDEFQWWMETIDGYRIVLGLEQWYYYATLDARGEYAPTAFRVGIDAAPQSSHQLQRTAARLAEIHQQRLAFEAQVECNAQWFAQKQTAAKAQGLPVVLRLGVILIEFADSAGRHHRDTTNPNAYWGYKKADFDSMLFSQNFWYAPAESLQYSSPHPEQERVYGSMKDYYRHMSRPNGPSGALIVAGNVVNVLDSLHAGVPLWIRLDSSKAWYDTFHQGRLRFEQETFQKAAALGYLGQHDKYALVYAGEAGQGELWPGAEFAGLRYITSERMLQRFSHIGVHCHEFGHLVGFHDEYCREGWTGCTDNFHFDLMASGGWNGPEGAGSCPAAVAPYYRIGKGWVTARTIAGDTLELLAQYDYEHPIYFRLNPIEAHGDEHFLFETRLRTGFDLYTPNAPSEFQHQTGTLLVWRNGSGTCGLDTDRVAYIPAGGNREDYRTVYFPRDRTTNRQSFNDFTNPAPELYKRGLAHLALNGISRNDEDFIEIDTILSAAGLGIIRENTTWSGYQTVSSNVHVVGGKTLTVSAGTQVIVESPQTGTGYVLKVHDESRLVALGQPAQEITFRSADGGINKWEGLSAVEGGHLQIRDAVVLSARRAIRSQQPLDSLVRIEIADGGDGLDIGCGNTVIFRCAFLNLSSALKISAPSGVRVVQSSFNGNERAIVCRRRSSQILSNEFRDGKSEIVLESGGAPEIRGNLFVGHQDQNTFAIHMEANDSIQPLITNNTVAEYGYGCLADPPLEQGTARPILRNNIFFHNVLSSSPEGGTIQGKGTLRYSNIYNLDSSSYLPPDTTNIKIDPMFVDPAHGNYALQFFSPSIDAGDPSDPFYLEPEPNGGRINQGHHGNTPLATRSFNVVTGGTISENSEWYGNVLVEKDVTVEEQATLTVNPGSVVRVTPKMGIDVLGTLIAVGESPVDSIKFIADVQHNPWRGIIVRNNPSESRFRYCSISDAYAGIAIETASPTVENSLIDNCSSGIDIYLGPDAYPQPVIRSNEIRNCKYGMYLHQACPREVRSNRIHSNDIGIYLFQSSPVFHQNVIENNYYGVYSEQSDPRFGDYIYGDRGNNVIRYNEGADLYALGGAPFLGAYGKQEVMGGYNSLYPYPGQRRCIIIAERNATVLAHMNWWGEWPPREDLFCASDGAKIDYEFPLSEDPNIGGGEPPPWIEAPTEEERILAKGLSDRGSRRYLDAISTYSAFVVNRPNSPRVRRALREARQTYRDQYFFANDTTVQNQLVSYLASVAGNHPTTPVRKDAFTMLAEEFHAKRDWNNAMAKYRQIVQTQPNSAYERTALFSLFSISAYGLRDTTEAGNVLAALRSKYPDDAHTQLAEIRYALLTDQLPPARSRTMPGARGQAEEVPKEFALRQNYPNPFNPVTTISYDLPRQSDVLIQIFNVLGQRVMTLVDDTKEAGRYTVTWDARSDGALHVASGVYFYRLKSGEFVTTKKLMILR